MAAGRPSVGLWAPATETSPCRKRSCAAPWWVSRSLYASRNMLDEALPTASPLAVPPRWQEFRTASVEVGLQNRFCRVPAIVRPSLQAVEGGIVHAQVFFRDLEAQVQRYCLGDVGVSTEMQAIYREISVAFWLEDVAAMSRPRGEHVRAFERLY